VITVPEYTLGCKKDQPDRRDFKITRMTATQAATLPANIDYTGAMSPVGNQYNEGTCVGFACVDGSKEYQDKKELGQYVDLSVRYVYANAKKIDNYPNEEGTEIRCGMKIMEQKGVCPESCWRYIPQVTGKPCGSADALAEPYKIEGYWRVDGVDIIQALKESLVANGPCVIGVLVYDGMFHAPKGVVPMPAEGEKCVGGHALCLVGYDDAKKQFKFKNSWGGLWGDGGYGYLPYAYMVDELMDAWSSRDMLGTPKPPKPWWVALWEFLIGLFSKKK